MTLHARKGDVVTCIKNNHPMFRMTEDIYPNTHMLASQFEAVHPDLPEPKVNELVPLCPVCGSACQMYGGGAVRFHFEDGFHK